MPDVDVHETRNFPFKVLILVNAFNDLAFKYEGVSDPLDQEVFVMFKDYYIHRALEIILEHGRNTPI